MSDTRLGHDLDEDARVSCMTSGNAQRGGRTGIETAAIISLIIPGSDILAIPPSRRMSEGTRSKACVRCEGEISRVHEKGERECRIGKGGENGDRRRTNHNSDGSGLFGEDSLFNVDDIHCEGETHKVVRNEIDGTDHPAESKDWQGGEKKKREMVPTY